MMWNTHALGGIQAGLLLSAVTNADLTMTLIDVGVATIGSVLPDIDLPESKISKSDIVLMLVSRSISSQVKHRREVHTVWFSLIFALITYLIMLAASASSLTGTTFLISLIITIGIDIAGLKIGSVAGLLTFIGLSQMHNISQIQLPENIALICAIAMFLGCIAHLVYDSFNMQGIMWAHPFKKKRYSWAKIITNTRSEISFRLIMLSITIAMFIVINPLAGQLDLIRFSRFF